MAELQANTKGWDCDHKVSTIRYGPYLLVLNEYEIIPKKAIALAKGSLENYFDKFVGNDSPFIKADQFDSSSNSAAASGDLPGLVLLEPATKHDRLQFQTASTASLAKFKFLNEHHHWDLNKKGHADRTVLWIAVQKSKHSLIRFFPVSDFNVNV